MKTILISLVAACAWAQSLPTTSLIADWNADSVSGTAGSQIASVTDSVAGCAATQATSGKQPYLLINAPGSNGHKSLMFWGANLGYLTIGNCLSIANASSYSLFVIARPHTINNSMSGVMMNVGTDQGRFYYDFDGGMGYYGIQGDIYPGGIVIPSQATLLGMTSGGSSITFYTNEASKTVGSFANTNTLTGGIIGSDTGAGNFINMEIYRVLVYSPAISSPNLTALRTYVNATYGSASARRTLIATGNALTSGYVLPTIADLSWPSQMSDIMRSDVRIYNIGFEGQDTNGMVTSAPTYGTPLCGQTGRDVAFIWEGTDDLLTYDAATSYGHMMTLAGLYRAAGCSPIIGTTIKAKLLTDNSRETIRTSYNSLLLAQGTYPVVDLAPLSQFSDTTNTTYFASDGTHLSAVGAGVVAHAVAAAIGDFGTSHTNVVIKGAIIK
jgi:hypothetical protein